MPRTVEQQRGIEWEAAVAFISGGSLVSGLCSIPGCTSPVAKRSARGWCMKHLRRYQRHGDPQKTLQPSRDLSREDRFWSKVDKNGGFNTCWEWTKARHEFGYGKFYDGKYRRNRKAHRVAWELAFGPIPDGLFVLHSCDNPPCCNPAHLFLGTLANNSQDMISKGRGKGQFEVGERHPCARLTENQVREMHELFSQGTVRRQEVAEIYGISYVHARHILSGLTWKYLANT